MPQDAFTLRYLCEELNGILSGGKINRITQPTSDITALTVYTRVGIKRLILNVDPSSPRIGIGEDEPKQEISSSNFCMLLRKHLLSATIKAVSLVGFDRIVKIDLIPSAEFFDSPEKTLYVELMGRYSNVILTENGKVLGGNRGINFLDNNVRPLIAGLPYKFPPVGDKVVPSDVAVRLLFSDKTLITAENLCAKIQGLALSTSHEIVNRYNNVGGDFYKVLNDFIYITEPRPCVIYSDGVAKDVLVYPYKSLDGEIREFTALYLAEENFFSEKENAKKVKQLKDRLLSVVSSGLKKSKKRLNAVNMRYKDAETAEENRIKGELILSNIYKLKGGERQAEFDNYYDGTKITVALDERLSPAKNAENYYKKYNKQKRAIVSLIPQKESAENEINYLNSVESEINLAETFSDLKAVESELILSGYINKVSQKKGKARENEPSPRVYEVYGFTVKVGRNNAENDKITFSAKPSDIWLHAKSYHSSHVIIETNGKKLPERVLIVSAEICAYYSKGRDGGKTEIVYCEKKFVKKPKKSALGFCTYTDFKSITVKPDSHAEMSK